MRFIFCILSLAALLSACGNTSTPTSTPTSTLGTDSAATKVGGIPLADSTGLGQPAGVK